MANKKERAEIAKAKMLRIFELISLLAGTKSTIQLAGALDTTTRTIYTNKKWR